MPEFIWELPAVRPEPDPMPEVTDGGAIDHVTAAINRLVIQFQKPKMKAMVRCFVTPIQKVEQAIIDLLTLRTLDNAVGEQLNVIGRIVGQKQVAVTDTTYRSLIRARIPANKSSGVAQDVLLVARLVFSDYAAQPAVLAEGTMRLKLKHYTQAEFALEVVDIDLPFDIAQLFVEQFMRAITGTGIRGVLEWVVQHDAVYSDHSDNCLELGDSLAPSTSAAHGLGDSLDAATGGRLTSAME